MEQKVRRKYSDEFKREAADLILVHGYGVAEAARNLGINANMLSRWKRELEEHGEHAFPGKGKVTPEHATVKPGGKSALSLRVWISSGRRLRLRVFSGTQSMDQLAKTAHIKPAILKERM